MGRLFAFDSNKTRIPKFNRRKGKVSRQSGYESGSTLSTLRNAPDYTDKYLIVHESESIHGKSAATATPLFWTCDLTDEALLELINRLPTSPDGFTNLGDAIAWASANDFMIISSGDNLPGGNLVLYFDARKVECWPGEGNILYDLSGNGNNATLNNDPIISGGFITWNGTNEFASIAFDSSMANWANAQTVVMWLRHSYTSGRRNPWDQADGGYGTWTHEHGNNINNYFGDAGRNAQPYTSGNSGTTNRDQWNLLVTTRNTSQQKWYVNGSHISTRSHSYGSLTTDTNVVRLARGYAGYWTGHMGPVVAYDKVLTDSEVKSIYYGGPITTNGLIMLVDSGVFGSYSDASETTTYDIAGGNHGTLTNGVGYDISRKTWTFDGSNDMIEFGNEVLANNGEYTLSAWLRPNGSSWGNNAIPLYNTWPGSSGAGGVWHHFGHDNVLRWRHGGGNYTTGELSGIGLVANQWQLTTLTWDGDTLTMYKNGVYANHTGAPGPITAGVGARIGRLNTRTSGTLYAWNGDIACHHVYDRALSSSEVLQNFNAQRARFGL